MSIYSDLGGEAAVTAALNAFYPKALADPRISPYFKGVNMDTLKKRVSPFMVMALGGPNDYRGAGLRKTHSRLVSMGLDGTAFDVFLGHFEDVLRELGVPAEKIAEIMPIFHGARSEVLNN